MYIHACQAYTGWTCIKHKLRLMRICQRLHFHTGSHNIRDRYLLLPEDLSLADHLNPPLKHCLLSHLPKVQNILYWCSAPFHHASWNKGRLLEVTTVAFLQTLRANWTDFYPEPTVDLMFVGQFQPKCLSRRTMNWISFLVWKKPVLCFPCVARYAQIITYWLTFRSLQI